MTVGDRDREMLDLGLAGRQIVGGAVSDRRSSLPGHPRRCWCRLETNAVSVPSVVPTGCTDTSGCRSDQLVKDTVPVLVDSEEVASSVTAPSLCAVITGASSVPVMVTATSCDVVPP